MRCALALLLLLLTGCVTTQPPPTYGVQPALTGYVPARIAILPCRAWPAGARYGKEPLTSAKDPDVKALCDSVDDFVLQGFNQQPYMKGFSPKFVLKALADAGEPQLVDKLPSLWDRQPGDDCDDCETPPAVYAGRIAKRQPWLAWLTDLAKAAHSADGVLLPFVTFASEQRFDDRGMAVAERAAGVALLLVDTNNGALIWAGGREAVLPERRLTAGNVAVAPSLPPWSGVTARLLTEDLWRDFPGRQVF